MDIAQYCQGVCVGDLCVVTSIKSVSLTQLMFMAADAADLAPVLCKGILSLS